VIGPGDEDELWAAVAEPTRRRLLDILLERGEATATALAEELPVTRQAVAKHLVVLERAGLIAGERRGRELRYTVRAERLDAATGVMARVVASWDRRLERVRQISEAAHTAGEPEPERARRP